MRWIERILWVARTVIVLASWAWGGVLLGMLVCLVFAIKGWYWWPIVGLGGVGGLIVGLNCPWPDATPEDISAPTPDACKHDWRVRGRIGEDVYISCECCGRCRVEKWQPKPPRPDTHQ